jgi:hypothetical protein
MANVLDPRFKLKYIKFCFDDLYDYDIFFNLVIFEVKTKPNQNQSPLLHIFNNKNRHLFSKSWSGPIT